MSNTEIKNMDFKQLRNEVQLLRDTIAIMQRKYEDLLYNLDDENLSGRMLKEKEDMKAEIKVTAEEISTKVSKDDLKTAITQTAEQIETTALKSISAKFVSSERPTNANTSDKEKRMLCEYDGNLYYYNLNTKTWKVYPTDGVRSQFIQTAYGFELDGDVVEISGDAIVKGKISADRIDTEKLSCTKLCSPGSAGYYAKLGTVGDFGLFSSASTETDNALSEQCIFGIHHGLPAVSLYSRGVEYIRFSPSWDTAFARGNWDFSECNSLKLPDDIDCVAKFG